MQSYRTMFWMLILAGAAARGQEAPRQTTSGMPIIRTEKRVVLVDTVVTDKKGNYIRDLTAKDFRLWEDNREQDLSSVSYEADPASPSNSRQHYLVLFFDNSTMGMPEQRQARLASEKFIDANTGPNRLIAIAEYGGALRIAQNFTPDPERLKGVVRGIKFSSVAPNAEPVQVASIGMPPIGNAERDFGVRSLMLALRSLAKSVAPVPGRKSVVLFTSGFPLTFDNRPELTAAIDACNKANVAIYPIDARGLVAGGDVANPRSSLDVPRSRSIFRAVSFSGPAVGSYAFGFDPQARGGSGGGGGTSGGGGSRGGSGGTSGGGTSGGTSGGGRGTGSGNTNPGRGAGVGVTNPGRGTTSPVGGGGASPMTQSRYARNPFGQSQKILPIFTDPTSGNQEVMYLLANGTGGFVIVNTNDLLGGLEKIGKEQNEYYIISYSPEDSDEGSCHSLRVKVNRGGTVVRSRSGYCNVKPVDLLAGKPIEKELENRAASAATGGVTASVRAPFFYTSPGTARVNVSLEIPTDSVKAEKKKGKFHAAVNILGIAYTQEDKVAARFSDTIKLDFDNKKEFEAFQENPFDYQNQFEIAPGSYTLKVAFSSGKDLGKVETPLVVDPYDGKKFSLSGVVLSRKLQKVSAQSGLDSELLEGKTPLVTQGVQVIPTANKGFAKTDKAVVYVEVYEPLLTGPKPPQVGVQLRVLDRKTGAEKFDSGMGTVADSIKPGNPVIAVGFALPVETLTPGAYRLEVKAIDTVGNTSPVRTAEFEMQ